MRRRAGCTRTAIWRGRKMIWLIQDELGRWLTTGQAKGWPRCTRCRRPHRISPSSSGLCTTCYFYKVLSSDEFWRRHEAGDPLAPYNIGRACGDNQGLLVRLNDEAAPWRTILRSQRN